MELISNILLTLWKTYFFVYSCNFCFHFEIYLENFSPIITDISSQNLPTPCTFHFNENILLRGISACILFMSSEQFEIS